MRLSSPLGCRTLLRSQLCLKIHVKVSTVFIYQSLRISSLLLKKVLQLIPFFLFLSAAAELILEKANLMVHTDAHALLMTKYVHHVL